MTNGLTGWGGLGWLAGALAGAAVAGYLFHVVFWWLFGRFARRTSTLFDDSLVRHCRRPTVAIAPILLVYIALPLLRERVEPELLRFVTNLSMVLLPLSVGWALIRLTNVGEDVVQQRYDVTVADNLQARAVHTQFRIIKRIAIVAVCVLTLGVILMSFDGLRQLGRGLLASAGLAGLVIGLAAQKMLANLLAGIQIALTQPMRLDDVVIVESEWGRIEEITLTYVVVKIWDERRLVLPISYFLEKPFQNWTRTTAEILGTVYLRVDHTVPVDAIRDELRRIVEGSDDWDGEVCGVVVTDTSPAGIEVRALVGSPDAGKSWNLRCEVREKLVAFVRENFPGSLPRVRTELHGGSGLPLLDSLGESR